MAAGKLVLLLLAGGFAGAGFAALTTGAISRYPDTSGSPSERTAREGDERPRSDEGSFTFDTPRWPFQAGAEDILPGFLPDDSEETALYEFDDGSEDDPAATYYREEARPPSNGAIPSARPRPPLADGGDAAAAAADRAADAAQDVLAAESAL